MTQFTSHSAGLKANEQYFINAMQWLKDGGELILPYGRVTCKGGKMIPQTMKAYISLRDQVSQGFIKSYVIKP
jgi:hypothetical protein